MPRLIYWEPVLTIEEFTVGYKFDLAYFWVYPSRDDLLCLSSFFKIGERSIVSTLVMRFQECYKTIVNCIYNLDNFKDEETAKYFESCSQSSKTTITTFEKSWDEKTIGVLGGDDDAVLATGTGCNPGTGYSFFPTGDIDGVVSARLLPNLYHYVAQRNNFQGGEV